jgi:hypothetical protein
LAPLDERIEHVTKKIEVLAKKKIEVLAKKARVAVD